MELVLLQVDEGLSASEIASKIKSGASKVKKALAQQGADTKHMLSTYKKVLQKSASRSDIARANREFVDLLKTVGLGVASLSPIPTTFAIIGIEKAANRKGYSILPSSWKSIGENMNEKTNNLVAKHARKYNKGSSPQGQRKKAMKRGERKHKGKKYEEVEEGRNYKKEYENYHSRPEQKKRRAARNGARRMLKDRKNIKGMDVHHKDNDPMNNDKSNLSIVSQKYNRTEPRLRKEELGPSAKMSDYIKDFETSDAPQFKGKSAEKRKEMAIAAYLDAKRGKKEAVSPAQQAAIAISKKEKSRETQRD